MAFDCFLKIDAIPGESTDDKHKDWIEVLSFSHGVSMAPSESTSSGGGPATERCEHDEFSIVKMLDAATPKLFLECCKGTSFPTVTVLLHRATGDKQKYVEYKMSDAIITAAGPGGDAESDDPLPTESVSFSYGKIQLTYVKTDHKTGKPKGDVTGWWDLVANKGG